MNNGSETTSKLKRKDRKKKMREKKDISYTIRRSADFPVIMIGEGILVGCFAGGVVLLYRICLNYAASWMQEILGLCQGHPGRTALWMERFF